MSTPKKRPRQDQSTDHAIGHGKAKPNGKASKQPSSNGVAHPPSATNGQKQELPSTTAQALKTRHVEHLWHRRIMVGMPTLLTGETQAGKSTLATAIATAVTLGEALPGGPKLAAGHVVWLAAEEHPQTQIKPRLIAAGANLRRVHFPGWDSLGQLVRRPRFTSGVPELRDFILAVGGRLLIVDPIGSFLDADLAEDNGHTAREVMQSLTDLCVAAGCGALVIKHPRKGCAGSALDQISGSKEWINQPRSSLVIAPHPHKEDLRVVASLKCNLGPKPPSLDVAIEYPGGISCARFLRENSLTADDVFSGEGNTVERSLLAEAKELLRDRLDTGEQPANEMVKAAEQAGLSLMTLQRAKKILGVTSHPKGPNEKRIHVWRKPAEGWPK